MPPFPPFPTCKESGRGWGTRRLAKRRRGGPRRREGTLSPPRQDPFIDALASQAEAGASRAAHPPPLGRWRTPPIRRSRGPSGKGKGLCAPTLPRWLSGLFTSWWGSVGGIAPLPEIGPGRSQASRQTEVLTRHLSPPAGPLEDTTVRQPRAGRYRGSPDTNTTRAVGGDAPH